MDLSLRGSENARPISVTASSALALSTSAMMTSAPLAASNIVVAQPMPREPPVTMATCPSSRLLRKVGSINMLTSLGLSQSEREVIETGGRTIQVGMPAKQAQRLGITGRSGRAAHRGRDLHPETHARPYVVGSLALEQRGRRYPLTLLAIVELRNRPSHPGQRAAHAAA
jgi:hypothetical protein